MCDQNNAKPLWYRLNVTENLEVGPRRHDDEKEAIVRVLITSLLNCQKRNVIVHTCATHDAAKNFVSTAWLYLWRVSKFHKLLGSLFSHSSKYPFSLHPVISNLFSGLSIPGHGQHSHLATSLYCISGMCSEFDYHPAVH